MATSFVPVSQSNAAPLPTQCSTVANTPESADMLREVIGRCPTHALHVEEHSA